MTVKVADFGLSRDVYTTDYYVMSNSTALPIKWLAPESIFDKIFTEKTDVVSSPIIVTHEVSYMSPLVIQNLLNTNT